jgi:hypothetical protein
MTGPRRTPSAGDEEELFIAGRHQFKRIQQRSDRSSARRPDRRKMAGASSPPPSSITRSTRSAAGAPDPKKDRRHARYRCG